MDHHQPNNPTRPTWNIGHTIPRFAIQNNVLNARDELFVAFFRRVAVGYARTFPDTARRTIEFGFLLQAFFVLAVFIHLHIVFIKSPITCLDHLISPVEGGGDSTKKVTSDRPVSVWSRYGVIRVEVIRNPSPSYSLADSYAKEVYGSLMDDDSGVSAGGEADGYVGTDDQTTVMGEPTKPMSNRQKLLQHAYQIWNSLKSLPHFLYTYVRERAASFYNKPSPQNVDAHNSPSSEQTGVKKFVVELFQSFLNRISGFFNSIVSFHSIPEWILNFHEPVNNENNFIMEYAVEYGFLRLSPTMRKHLNITVDLVVLDPDKDSCFGGPISRFLMEEFLGYDELLLGSIKRLAVRESVKGHMLNVITGQHYRFVSGQTTRTSYIVALLVMSLFTFCVSVLLRYSSHQLVVVVADLLQVFEGNLSVGIPGTPFMTVILALVAMETIMSEFFGDSFTAFYVILIVSLCDHYEAVFCRSPVSQRYWPRFFYIYQFSFYAYHYRFNGQLSGMALWVSWLFTLHSMIYFFHHYELPNLLSDWTMRELLVREPWVEAPSQFLTLRVVSSDQTGNTLGLTPQPTTPSTEGSGAEGQGQTSAVRLRQRQQESSVLSAGDTVLIDITLSAGENRSRESSGGGPTSASAEQTEANPEVGDRVNSSSDRQQPGQTAMTTTQTPALCPLPSS